MKPFDLQAAKDGAELVTREGKPARILCYDFLYFDYKTGMSQKCIAAAIKEEDEKGTKYEMFAFYDISGKATIVIPDNEKEKYDLFIKRKKREGYVAIYKDTTLPNPNYRYVRENIWKTEEIAKNVYKSDKDLVAISKIEWEE